MPGLGHATGADLNTRGPGDPSLLMDVRQGLRNTPLLVS